MRAERGAERGAENDVPEEHTHISLRYPENLKKKEDYLIGSLSGKGAFCTVLSICILVLKPQRGYATITN